MTLRHSGYFNIPFLIDQPRKDHNQGVLGYECIVRKLKKRKGREKRERKRGKRKEKSEKRGKERKGKG